jgi:hypothetical protein
MAQRQRKRVEILFAELKNQTGLRRWRLKFGPGQFFLAAAAQNIERLVPSPQPTDKTGSAAPASRTERENTPLPRPPLHADLSGPFSC